MPNSKPPTTYDDLARKLTPLPDSSYRPSRAEVEAAHNRPQGPRIQATDHDAVRAVLANLDGADLTDIDVMIEDGLATLDGSVAKDEDRTRVVEAVHTIPGVTAVIDQLRVRL